MKQLDRYLKTVGTFLPGGQKDDILKELMENILSKIEDKEAELGRPLTDAEQEDILRGYGNPLAVASRYGAESGGLVFGQQLISPALFPFYLKVLGLNLLVALAIVIGLTVALDLPSSGLFSQLIILALLLSAVVTFAFVLLQRYVNQHPERWDLLDPEAMAAAEEQKAPRVSRLDSMLEIVLLAIILALLSKALASPNLLFSPFQPAPVWYQLYWVLVLFPAVNMLQAAINLIRPNWTRFRLAIQAGIQLGLLVVIALLLVAGQWVVLTNAAGLSADEGHVLDHVLSFINLGFLCALWIGVVIAAVQLVLRIRDLRRSSRQVDGRAGT